MPPPEQDLKALALRLAKDGPVKTLPTLRRVRLFVDGCCIADTLGTIGALFVWEHPYYPQYYIPNEAFQKPEHYFFDRSFGDEIKDSEGNRVADVINLELWRSKHPETKRIITNSAVHFVVGLKGPARELDGMVKVNFGAVDQWLEEDTPIYVHPKDPFKRVDIITSTRAIRISLNNHILAETPTSMHLYETSLPTRYYMPLTALDTSLLRPSRTKTQCPYKGEAEYYSVVIGEQGFKDIVWFYTTPTIECAAIAGLCCFYNEKVDVEIMGRSGWEKLERPKTMFG